MSRYWPNWRPESELRAIDLAGLEDYLLARSDLAEGNLHGLESFDYSQHLRLERQPGAVVLRVIQVSGVTPSGQPVIVGADDECSTQFAGLVPEPVFDVFIRVSAVTRDASATKLWLLAESIPDAAVPAVCPGDRPDELFLGRYAFDASGAPTIIHFPMVRRFSALQPEDERWLEWTRPIRASLDASAPTASSVAELDAPELVKLLEVTRLQHTWTTLPITLLRRKLQLVAALGELDERKRPAQIPAIWPTLRTELGNELPRRLARILARSPQRPFATVLAEVLRPVTVRVPLRAYEEWARHLANIERFGDSAAADGSGFDEGVETVLESPLVNHIMDEWTRVGGLTTIWTARTYHQENWGEQAIALYRTHPTDSIEMSVARSLDLLLARTGARDATTVAAPLGLYRIVRAMPSDLRAAADRFGSEPLRDYLRTVVEQRATRSDHPALLHVQTRLSDRPKSTETVEAQPLFPRAAPVQHAPLDVQRIVVTGEAGSGRSSLCRALRELLAGTPALRIAGVNSRDLIQAGAPFGARPDADAIPILRGGQPARIRVDDAPLDDIGGRAALVIVTIPPEVVEERREDLASRAARMISDRLAGDPATRFALAFTRADEYGVLEKAGRMLRERELTEYKKSWESLLRNLSIKTLTIFGPGRSPVMAAQPWGDTSAAAVNATRPIWDVLLARRGAEPLLNGYFVVAAPRDDFFEPLYRRGYGQLLADALASI